MYPVILDVKPSEDSLTVKWIPNQEVNFDRYEIWLSSVSNSKGDKVDVITTQSLGKHTISGLDANHQYYVTIETWNTAGLSTASNPWAVSTDEVSPLKNPLVLVVIATIVVVIFLMVTFNSLVKKQKATTASESMAGTTSPVTGGSEEGAIEIEAIEEETSPRPTPPTTGGPSDDPAKFMRQMQGDEEV
jgi:hypothetical protein